jgi:hypothetical protein
MSAVRGVTLYAHGVHTVSVERITMPKNKRYHSSGSMLSNDPSADANMPQNVIQKAYPEVQYINSAIDDTIAVINAQMKADLHLQKRSKSKY